MWNSCVMTWKTFLDLFKIDYSLFCYYEKQWHFKFGGIGDIPIILQYNETIIHDGVICFIDSFQNAISLVDVEELNGKL